MPIKIEHIFNLDVKCKECENLLKAEFTDNSRYSLPDELIVQPCETCLAKERELQAEFDANN